MCRSVKSMVIVVLSVAANALWFTYYYSYRTADGALQVSFFVFCLQCSAIASTTQQITLCVLCNNYQLLHLLNDRWRVADFFNFAIIIVCQMAAFWRMCQLAQLMHDVTRQNLQKHNKSTSCAIRATVSTARFSLSVYDVVTWHYHSSDRRR